MVIPGNKVVTLWNVREDTSEPQENYKNETIILFFLPSVDYGRNSNKCSVYPRFMQVGFITRVSISAFRTNKQKNPQKLTHTGVCAIPLTAHTKYDEN